MAVSAVAADVDSTCPACGFAPAAPDEDCPACGTPLAREASTVERWRGYVSSTFFLCAADGAVVAESPAFRWRKREAPPDEPAAREALEALTRELEALRWTRHDPAPGDAWFERRFTTLVPRAQPPVPGELAPLPPLVERPPVIEERAAPPPRPAPRPHPLPAAAPPGTPAPTPAAPGGRRSRLVSVLSVAGLVLASGLGYVVLTEHSHGATKVVRVRAVHRQQHLRPAPAAAPAAAAQQPRARTAHLVVTAKRASWVEIRRGSSTGRVVYAGDLAPGGTLRVAAPRIWARFGAAANVEVTANGKPLALSGTLERVFAPPSR